MSRPPDRSIIKPVNSSVREMVFAGKPLANATRELESAIRVSPDGEVRETLITARAVLQKIHACYADFMAEIHHAAHLLYAARSDNMWEELGWEEEEDET